MLFSSGRCSEDYRWWWRSFLTSGSTALYVFLYSVAYFVRLEGNMFVTYLLYFGYMGVISLGFFLVTGTQPPCRLDFVISFCYSQEQSFYDSGSVGFFASLFFNYQIYGSIKVDWLCDVLHRSPTLRMIWLPRKDMFLCASVFRSLYTLKIIHLPMISLVLEIITKNGNK